MNLGDLFVRMQLVHKVHSVLLQFVEPNLVGLLAIVVEDASSSVVDEVPFSTEALDWCYGRQKEWVVDGFFFSL